MDNTRPHALIIFDEKLKINNLWPYGKSSFWNDLHDVTNTS